MLPAAGTCSCLRCWDTAWSVWGSFPLLRQSACSVEVLGLQASLQERIDAVSGDKLVGVSVNSGFAPRQVMC
jgi:hypothetical protein